MAAEEGERAEPFYLTLEDALEIFAAVVGGTVSEALNELNGFGMNASDAELADWIIGFSRGVTPHEMAQLIRPCLIPAR